jgi:hypothetical protein
MDSRNTDGREFILTLRPLFALRRIPGKTEKTCHFKKEDV